MASHTAQPPRPSPEALLRHATREARGQLKIFLGAAPGVGKTYEMLTDGAERLRAGVDVVVAVVETHGRAETEALIQPFEIIPRREIEHHGRPLTEMDIDAVLARRPQLALVDEYAHSNVEGSRHPKRWQDVEELLAAGIDVYTTLNIQHVESLNDVVASFTRVRVRETVPDSVFEGAEIKVVDLPPDELIERLKDGKVYVPEEATRALQHFFSKPNLSALREMALRRAALSVDRQMLEMLDAGALPGVYAGGERVLVAVSEQPGGDALIRVAKRLADALRAPWSAIVIETARAEGFNEAQRQRVADVLRLAASLGATIARVPAEDVASGLIDHIAGTRTTQLVIGKSRRSWWFEARHGSVVDRLLKEGPEGLALHVIPATAPAERPRRGLAPLTRGWGGPSSYGAALALVAVTTVIDHFVEPLVGAGGLDLIYLLPVILTAARFGLRTGLFASLAAGLAYNFFFLPPLYNFTIADPQSLLTMLVLIGIAGLVSHLAGRLKARATLSTRSATENASVAAFAQALARSSTWQETASTICTEVGLLLGCDTLLLAERDGVVMVKAAVPEAAPLGPVDQAAAEWCWSRGEPAGRGTATLTAADWQFHPLKTALGTLAVLGLARDDGTDPVPADRTVLLSTLVGQAALAHERLRLEGEMRELGLLKERDRLRAALLSSIGHDLRTPLTSVAGAVEALAAEAPASPAVAMARAEVRRLKRFLDNLVDMVRMDAGALQLVPEPIDLTDAVSSAVHDLRDTLRHNRIDLAIPGTLPLVRTDPRLLHHILINLLANATQHGGPEGPIAIEARRVAGGLLLEVRDHGPGIEPGAEEAIFETFARGKGSDRSGDSGLGLAIVKGFADALGIGVAAATDPAGGAIFTLDIPEEALVAA
ncbi:sensor histidine kinase [Sphingomonas oligoaromativorans]|uniref:sensor histidine kinase n=1 Tax=Sphingomonas oligoaromativorans TaxID=575322 RepID=UPI001421CD0F|nr:sensor histidine kinase KdpD [Sphingomonas oligoaromativorans]NIJ33091.1 two-component system sensor histidine kinase KdpD [Sphingomonas oligoaromativorans]